MADRDLTLKLGTELKPGAADPLKQIGKAAADSTRPVNDLFQKADDNLLRMKSNAAEAGDVLLSSFRAAGSEMVNLQWKLEQFDAKYRDFAKKVYGGGTYGHAVGVDPSRLDVRKKAGILGEAAGMLGLPQQLGSLGGAFAALTATVKAADAALNIYKGSLYGGQFSQTQFVDKLQQTAMDHLPSTAGTIVGGMSRNDTRAALAGPLQAILYQAGKNSTNQKFRGFVHGLVGAEDTNEANLSANARREELMDRIATVRDAGQRGRITSEMFRRRLPLQMEQEELAARGQYGYLSYGGGHLGVENLLRSESLQRQRQTGGVLGYGRQEEMEDVMLRMRTEAALRQENLTGQRQFGIAAAKSNLAGGVLGEQQQKHAETQRQMLLTQENVAKADKTGDRSIVEKARYQLEAQYVNLMEQEARLREAETQKLTADRDILQTTVGIQQQKVLLLKQEGDAIATARRQEEASLRLKRESLGLMHPTDLRTSLGIARKADSGQQLNYGELRYMQAHADIFGQKLQEEGAKRYNAPGPMADMMRELQQRTGYGSETRLRQLEGMQVENDVKIQVELGTTDAIMEQLQKTLVPMLENIEDRLKMQMQNLVNRVQNQMWMNRNATMPDLSR